MKDIENPMVIDSLWNDEPIELEVVGECAGCGEDIVEGDNIYQLDDFLIHSTTECCRDFIANNSFCRVAGQ